MFAITPSKITLVSLNFYSIVLNVLHMSKSNPFQNLCQVNICVVSRWCRNSFCGQTHGLRTWRVSDKNSGVVSKNYMVVNPSTVATHWRYVCVSWVFKPNTQMQGVLVEKKLSSDCGWKKLKSVKFLLRAFEVLALN